MEQNREAWGSKFGYIMATAGFAVGFGSIWRFPYLVGTSGGGAFVFVYLILSLLIGVPLFTAEMVLGRKAKSTPIDGMRRLTKKGSPWVLFGWLSLGSALFIMAYYNVLLGYILIYIVKMAKGDFVDATIYSSVTAYNEVSANPWILGIASIVMLAILGYIVMLGLKNGIEKYCKILMPMLLIIIINTAIAIVAGLCMFPAIFAFGMEPDLGASLIFKTMPLVFSKIPMGRAFGTVFFILVLIAAGLTAIGFIEAIAGALSDAMKWAKKKCIVITLVVIFLLNIPAILSYDLWKDVKILGKNFFDFYDYISGNIMLPWAGVVLCGYIIFKWGFTAYKNDANMGAKGIKVANWWKPIVLVVAPVFILIVAVISTFRI